MLEGQNPAITLCAEFEVFGTSQSMCQVRDGSQHWLELRGEARAENVKVSSRNQVRELRAGQKSRRRGHSGGHDNQDNNKIVVAATYGVFWISAPD